MQRRFFLQTAAGASILPILPMPASAGGTPPAPVAAQSFRIGEATVTALSDGFLPIDAATLQGVSPEDYASLLAAAYIPDAVHNSAVNAFLIDLGGRRVLVDAGTGTMFGPSLGRLAGAIEALGIDPGSVDAFFATHLHADHIGGLISEAGNPFTAAALHVHSADIDFWTSEEIRAQSPEQFHMFFDAATAAVESFDGRVETFGGEADLGGGLTALPLPGHTPGHAGLMVESGGEGLMICGDIVHVGPVQFARPEVTIAFDIDPDMARETRIGFLDRAASDRLMIAGAHIGFPGVGFLERAGEGYHFVPAPFDHG